MPKSNRSALLFFILALACIPSIKSFGQEAVELTDLEVLLALTENTLGTWRDNSETYVYTFQKDNDFLFRGQKWLPKPNGGAYEPRETKGAWQYSRGMCWLGENKEQPGNVMIYADTLQCCFNMRSLGSKLLLTKIWEKGQDALGICNNRVLNQVK